MGQRVLWASHNYAELDSYFEEGGVRSFLLVCDNSFPCLQISRYFKNLVHRAGIKITKFDGFQPNPLYESVIEGVRVFREARCDSIVAVGGGSAIDVAKCIKLYCNMDGGGLGGSFLEQAIMPNPVRLLAVPTTAGTGSEATRYAVIYYEGEKQSISHESCIPDTVFMDGSTLATLPLYQKKATMLDALCHGVESFWSVNSTEESRRYSEESVRMVMGHMEGYLSNKGESNAGMLMAAHLAGKAIDIAQTTAGHAMCYKLTSLYGIAHGHAAALCVKEIWPWMIENMDQGTDPRGKRRLEEIFCRIAAAMGCESAEEAASKFREIFHALGMGVPAASGKEHGILCSSVNPVRLKNHPVPLGGRDIDELYHRILRS